jgi:Gly-Xaa carboxypeptidase
MQEPSPVDLFDTDVYKNFMGMVKQVIGKDVSVAPSFLTENTKMKYYWEVGKIISRFAPVKEGGRENAPTVDEKTGTKEHAEDVRFCTQLVLNGGL